MMEIYQLRELQLKELEILKEIKRICDKHELTYYLSGGSCLGAVRHNGFIPWDDDIDIMMPYDSYTRFLSIASNELSEEFFLQNYMTDKHDHQGFTKIRMNKTAMIMPNHKRWKIHQGVWLDVFPLIRVQDADDLRKKKRLLSMSNYLQMDSFILDNEEEFKEILKVLYYPYRIFLKLPIRFRIAIHRFMLKYTYDTREDAKYCSEAWGTLTNMYPVSIQEGEPVYHRFEDDYFPLLPGYKEYLEMTYGDYMKFPPVEERKGHGNLIVDLDRSYDDVLQKIQ